MKQINGEFTDIKEKGVASQHLTYLLTLLGFTLRTISKKAFICSKNLIDMSNVETRPQQFFPAITCKSPPLEIIKNHLQIHPKR